MGGRRGHRRRRGCPRAAELDAHGIAEAGRRDVLPPRGLAPFGRRGRVPRRGAASPPAGARCRPVPPRSASPRSPRCPRIEQLVLAPSEHPRRRAPRVPGAPARRARSRRLRRVSLLPHGDLQGALRGRAACALLPGSRGSRRSRSRSRSSTSASRRTRSRAGSAPSRSACSATTARSTRSTATSRGRRRASGRSGDEPALAPALDPRRVRLGAARQRARAARPRSTARDLAEALSVLVPPAWQNDPRLDDDVRDFHRYGAMLSEPWDGPAALCFTDGRTCGAALDRNGLRPLRVAVAGDELLAVSSEAGAVPLPDGAARAQDAVGAGRHPDARSRPRPAGRRRAPTRHCSPPPYGRLGRREHRPRGRSASPRPAGDGSLDARHVLHGYTREELNAMLRPLAQTGHDPVSSMGDDTAIAPLAGRDRPLTTYLRQRFAQVTNPAHRPPARAARDVGLDAARPALAVPLPATAPLPPLTVAPGLPALPVRCRGARAARPRRDVHRGGGASAARSTGSPCSPSRRSLQATRSCA